MDPSEDGDRGMMANKCRRLCRAVAMAVAGRETSSIELTAVLQTHPCHPLLQANRAALSAPHAARVSLSIRCQAMHASTGRP